MEERNTVPIYEMISEEEENFLDTLIEDKPEVKKAIEDELSGNLTSLRKPSKNDVYITGITTFLLILAGNGYKYRGEIVSLFWFMMALITGIKEMVTFTNYRSAMIEYRKNPVALTLPGLSAVRDMGEIFGKSNLFNALFIKLIGYLENLIDNKDSTRFLPEALRKLIKLFDKFKSTPGPINVVEAKEEISKILRTNGTGPLSIDFDGQPLTINIAGKDGPISLTIANVVSVARGKSRRGYRKKRRNKSRRNYKRK
jgi:hypothetical protein